MFTGSSVQRAWVSGQAKNLQVKHHSDNGTGQFVMQLDGGNLEAVLKYRKMSENELDLISTTVPSSHEGQGIGKVLALAAFDHCVAQNYKMKLTCWYLEGFLKRNPQEKYTNLLLQ